MKSYLCPNMIPIVQMSDSFSTSKTLTLRKNFAQVNYPADPEQLRSILKVTALW